ncbi:MAG: DUF1735 and LamG domain-containing protein [Prevotella sp.]|nr:DUF1735 and LamG domain-containing protein [Prevotella sp.]MDY3852485.1 DUF1735 and LamG domain-containing protein [Prevotella sp.]
MKFRIKQIATALCLTLLASCQESPTYYDGVYIVGTEGKDVTTTLTVDDLPSAIGVQVASSTIVEEDVSVNLTVRPDLVESFNNTHHKNYEVLPESAYKIDNSNLTIKKGKHITTDGLRISIVNRDEMKFGKTYLVPVSITEVKGNKLSVIEASRTIYVIINQIIVTQAANLEKYGAYYMADFSKESKYNTKALRNVTFEARVRFRSMTPYSNKWCFSVMGLEENLCLRTAGSKTEGWRLQVGDPHHVDSRDVLPNDKWVHVACVFNGDAGKKSLYINGELQAEIADNRASIDLTQFYAQRGFYIGQSANDDRYMNGWVSEARVWATARSAAELKNNVCWVDPLSEGLVAYWRFNEVAEAGSKNVTDLTGNGYTATFAGWAAPTFVPGVRCPE